MSSTLRLVVPTALEYFATLVGDEKTLSLTEAAASIAQDDFPHLDTQAVLADIDRLAERIRRHLPPEATPVQRLQVLRRFFFQELGLGGNFNNFYDPCNSYLHSVLRTRRGIPISLAVLLIELAEQIGLTVAGVSFPGHFLVRLYMPEGEVVMDPLNGTTLSREELIERLLPYHRSLSIVGGIDEQLSFSLQAVTARNVLARMLRNLKEIHQSTQDWPRGLAVLNRLVILLPEAWEERRDRGLVHAEMGGDIQAIRDLTLYLERVPQSTDRCDISQRLVELVQSNARRMH